MDLLKRAAAVGASVALLGSLVATVAAPFALASTSVVSAGSIPVGGTSTGTATFYFTENSKDAFPNPLGGSLTVTVLDYAGGNTLTLGGGTLSAPGYFRPTFSVSGNTFTVTTNGTTDFDTIERIIVSGITIHASSTAALGAVRATLDGSLAPAVTEPGQTDLASPGVVVRKVAPADGPKTCWVKNTTLNTSYDGVTGAVLQAAIDAAASGDTLEVRGRCIGNFTIATKDLALAGKAKGGYPVATLDGNLWGSVLQIGAVPGPLPEPPVPTPSKPVVVLTDLLITGGSGSQRPGSSPMGGGIVNHGSLTLSGSTSVRANMAYIGGGIVNYGSLTLDDAASVNRNTASYACGGIYNYGGEYRRWVPDAGTLTLNDFAEVSENSAQGQGGISNGAGAVILNDHARVSGNTAEWQAGGVSTWDGSLILNDFARINDNASGLGGGIVAAGMIGGTVTLNDFAQVNGNTAVTGNGLGGGIYLSLGTLTLNDAAEVSGNRASADGGGIYRYGGRLIGATNGGNVHDNTPNDLAPFGGAQPATGRTATSLEIGGTSVLVILDPGSCSFAGAGMVRFPPYPEWVTLIAVTPAGPGQELLTIRPTTARHLVGEAVEGATLCPGG